MKALYRRAKTSGDEHLWKEAHKARRAARDKWHAEKVARAGQGSWKDYRELKPCDGPIWAVHLSEEAFRMGKEPLKWTIEHFKAIFTAPRTEPPLPEWGRSANEESPPFSLDELGQAVAKGRRRRAVGLDLTSYELLSHLMHDDTSTRGLLQWLEEIRTGRPIPPEWLQTVITLLPKVPNPSGPSDLRPISLGSTIGKVFGQMLLGRTRQAISPEQCAHSGRQTADYIFSAVRTFQLETEWRWGLHWMN